MRISDWSSDVCSSDLIMTMRALEVAKEMQGGAADVAVLHVPTIKPLDEAVILREAAKPGRLVIVAENHSVVGGLGEAVASLVLRSPVRSDEHTSELHSLMRHPNAV